MAVYYNEIDRGATAWLRELIAEDLIPGGEVDERDIRDVRPDELAGFTQCHFFAGIGGWPYALRLAGWPEDRPVWTGSCPCQPFSTAGKREGVDDERHLWPAFRWLVAQRRPATVFGEQVASPAGREWLAGIRSDLERMGYAVGGADLCAAGVGSPNMRQRLWWGGVSDSAGPLKGQQAAAAVGHGDSPFPASGGSPGTNGFGEGVDWSRAIWWPCRDGKWRRVPARRMADPIGERRQEGRTPESEQESWLPFLEQRSDAERILGDIEPLVEPSLFPLAHGLPGRVGLLRGAGNAINPVLAAEFVMAYMETLEKPLDSSEPGR